MPPSYDPKLQKIFNEVTTYCNAEHHFDHFDPSNPKIRLNEPTFSAEEINAALETLLSTHVTMGKRVRSFEAEYAHAFDCQYAVSNNSGSSANLLAIAALSNPATRDGLRPGDEVIVPALSWSTTIWPLIQHQLLPVFVDCDIRTLNLDPEQIERAITPKTRAIMLVHVYGNPCDMDAILSIAQKHNLIVIEDSCESMGATYRGKPVGSLGRIGTFSLYFSHHITTLEGGMCVTNDFELTELMRILRAHGWTRETDSHNEYIKRYPDIDPRFIFVNLGYNLRMTETQAAMGKIQLPKLQAFVEKRRRVAEDLKKQLAPLSEFFSFQEETKHSTHSWFGFSVLVKKNASFTIKDITPHLNTHGIETRPIIAGNMTRHPAFTLFEHKISGSLENSDTIMQHGFAIPCHQAMNEKSVEHIVNAFRSFLHTKGLANAA